MIGQRNRIVGGRFVGREQQRIRRAAGVEHCQHAFDLRDKPRGGCLVARDQQILGEFEQRIKLLVKLKRRIFGAPVRQIAARPDPVLPLRVFEHPEQMAAHNLILTGAEQRAGGVIGIPVPRQRQQHVIGQEAHTIADRDRVDQRVDDAPPHQRVWRAATT